MLITRDFSEFEPWSGAVETWDRIKQKGKEDDFESLLEDCYGEYVSETTINDILWFEEDWVFSILGIRSPDDIKEEINNLKLDIEPLKEECEELKTDFENEIDGMTKMEINTYWEKWYKNDIVDKLSEIEELEEQIEKLEEELDE